MPKSNPDIALIERRSEQVQLVLPPCGPPVNCWVPAAQGNFIDGTLTLIVDGVSLWVIAIDSDELPS